MNRDFDPKWPHGHMRRGDGAKAEILRVLEDGRVVAITTARIGIIEAGIWNADGTDREPRRPGRDLINAPAAPGGRQGADR